MSKNRVLCEIDPLTRKLVRILRHGGTALFLRPEQVVELPKIEAVSQIRRQVFEKYNNRCRHCDKLLTWQTGHCDEIIPKSKQGEVSIENCQLLCADCHIGPKGKHGDRLPQFSKCIPSI